MTLDRIRPARLPTHKAILAGARTVFCNPALAPEDLMEWKTSEIGAEKGEVVAYAKDPGAWVAIKVEQDKRTERL